MENRPRGPHPQEEVESTAEQLPAHLPAEHYYLKSWNRTVVNFLEKEDLSAHQFGFRRKLGTSDLLTLLQHEWSSAIASHGAVNALAIDIAGAFDKVAHRRVLAKAQSCGITGTLLAWLQAYLKDRSLQAVIWGQESAQYPISAGVPQGSILGPTLFHLYVNDCADHLPGGSSLAVYAGDTTLYKCIACIGDIHDSSTQLQSAVDAVAAWGQSWKIQFEPTKSQALTLSSHRPPLFLPPPPPPRRQLQQRPGSRGGRK